VIGDVERETELLVDGELEYEIEKILDMRNVRGTQ
jgi:hypothetical protein